MTDVALGHARAPTSGFFTLAAMQKAVAFVGLIALVAFFSFFAENFAQWSNVVNILQATAVNGVLGVAATFAIITAGIDLSIGVLMTFAAVTSGVFITNWGLPMGLGVIAPLIAGTLCGAVSGFCIAKLKIPPFIATLGMMQALKGLNLIISGVKPIYFLDSPYYSLISLDSSISFLFPGVEIPNSVFIMFAVAVVAAVVLNKSLFGRYVFALGSNEEAARLSGVNVDFWKMLTYAVGGFICGIAGLIISSRLNSAQPALGPGYELDAIAAVVIGGTSLSGGRGSIMGTIIGAFIISVLNNGLRMMGVEEQWQYVVTGVIIIIAVYVDNVLRRRS